jgi:hypothetical protein
VLVSQTPARVETFFRKIDATWVFATALGLRSVARLRSLRVELPLAEVYAGVKLPT